MIFYFIIYHIIIKENGYGLNGKTIIIIHEIYGVTGNLLKLKSRLIKKGFSVILPSLYDDNYCGFDEQKSYKKFYDEVGVDKGFKLIDKVITGNADSEIILVGFSVGATIAWLHSADKRISTVIGIYGSRIREYPDITPSAQSYLFFCREKSFDIIPLIDELNKKNNVTACIINGEHGFYSFSGENNKSLITKIDKKIFRILGFNEILF